MTVRPAPVAPVDQDTRKKSHQNTSRNQKAFRTLAYPSWKRAIELSLCCVMLVPISIGMTFVALAILLLEGKPILYSQNRVGLRGRIFRIFKFRTMRPEAESKTGPVWSAVNDNRVTPLGKWLRKTHLDELPQLYNVLRGDMSLVGPRPERPEFVEQLKKAVDDYDRRHDVRPGITGLAQLRLGYDTCLHDVSKKTALDLAYIRQCSFLTDMTLLVQTIPYVLGKSPKKEVLSAATTHVAMCTPSQLMSSVLMANGQASVPRPAKTIPRRRSDVASRFPELTTASARNLVGASLARLDEHTTPFLSP